MYRIVGCILVVAAGAGMGIFRKYETFGADPHTGKTASDGDLPERPRSAAGMHHCRMLFMEQQEE